jgi:hypothetical protein
LVEGGKRRWARHAIWSIERLRLWCQRSKAVCGVR